MVTDSSRLPRSIGGLAYYIATYSDTTKNDRYICERCGRHLCCIPNQQEYSGFIRFIKKYPSVNLNIEVSCIHCNYTRGTYLEMDYCEIVQYSRLLEPITLEYE